MKIDWMARAAAEILTERPAVTTKTPKRRVSPVSVVTAGPISETRIVRPEVAHRVVRRPPVERVDADRFCWPHGVAMNTMEFAAMKRRLAWFAKRRIPLVEAERLADRLVLRDRDLDDRVMCIECSHGTGRTCPNGVPLPRDVLHRCHTAEVHT